jgi:hypothetical protein
MSDRCENCGKSLELDNMGDICTTCLQECVGGLDAPDEPEFESKKVIAPSLQEQTGRF